jgi:hypothetical protein
MTTDWSAQANQMFKLWSEGQKAWLESLSRPPAAFGVPGLANADAPGPGTSFAHTEGVQEAARRLNETWKASIDQWMALLQQGTQFTASQEHLRKILDPAEWAKPVPGSFDSGIERIIEGPSFATLWDLDRKMLKLQQLGMRRAEDSAAYHAVVFAAWSQALERFMRELADRERAPLGSFRELIDLWIKTANDTLIEVHRSPEFLEAQRRVTRSATDYRLAEREVAESYCEMHHIPTRTEVDELARAVHELRREVRALLRRFDADQPGRAVGKDAAATGSPRKRGARRKITTPGAPST